MHDIPLGFEVGTGKPVAIPCRHMVVCGQTQIDWQEPDPNALETFEHFQQRLTAMLKAHGLIVVE